PTHGQLEGTSSNSVHETSAGKTRVLTFPRKATVTASAASESSASEREEVRTQLLNGLAAPSTSEVKGASSSRWFRAWSPTTFTTGDKARFALCKLEFAFANPGPKWRSVAAGRSSILP